MKQIQQFGSCNSKVVKKQYNGKNKQVNYRQLEERKTRQIEIVGEGINTLFDLRNQIMETLTSFNKELSREDFDAIPFINADGYHNKTIAYSIWHIFRMIN